MQKAPSQNSRGKVWLQIPICICIFICFFAAPDAGAETLSLRTDPGLVVFLDGKTVGRTSGSGDLFEVAPGRHVLQLRGDELESDPITFTVRKGYPFFLAVPRGDLRHVHREASRMPQSGVLVVTSSPKTCEVILLGMVYQKTEAELTLTGVPVGEHAVQLRLGETLLQGKVAVELGRKTHLRGDFENGRFEVVPPARKALPKIPVGRSGPPHEGRRNGAPAPVQVGGSVRAPIKISGSSEIGSPEDARTYRVAIVDVIIDEQGRVESLRVTSASGRRLASMARATVRSWRFEPATQNGRPVAVYWRVRFTQWLP